ncbi:hypothetical protein EVAR_36145_1 [Eumeta japonica]|uniref:Uncharacterized protein n=1 Tax=Eumeta variegata TaxID=151549 RepID=A0A4C1X2V9_EUMVA|nr:hypothetical protein EVAR_36145_1 [Eumeta japonica]
MRTHKYPVGEAAQRRLMRRRPGARAARGRWGGATKKDRGAAGRRGGYLASWFSVPETQSDYGGRVRLNRNNRPLSVCTRTGGTVETALSTVNCRLRSGDLSRTGRRRWVFEKGKSATKMNNFSSEYSRYYRELQSNFRLSALGQRLQHR